jgi:hypothetical protein
MAKTPQPPAKAPSRKLAVKQKSVPPKPPSMYDNLMAYRRVAESPYFRDTLGVTSPVDEDYEGRGANAYYTPSKDRIFVNTRRAPDAEDPQQTPAGSFTAKSVLTHEGAHSLTNKEDKFPSYFAVNRPNITKNLAADENFSYVGKQPLDKINIWQRQKGRVVDDKEFDLNKNVVTEKNKPKYFGMFGSKDVDRTISQPEKTAIEALDRYYALGGMRSMFGGEFLETDPNEALAQAYTNAAGFLSETANDTTDFRNKIGRYEGNTPGAGAIVLDLLKGNPIYKNHPLKSIIR